MSFFRFRPHSALARLILGEVDRIWTGVGQHIDPASAEFGRFQPMSAEVGRLLLEPQILATCQKPQMLAQRRTTPRGAGRAGKLARGPRGVLRSGHADPWHRANALPWSRLGRRWLADIAARLRYTWSAMSASEPVKQRRRRRMRGLARAHRSHRKRMRSHTEGLFMVEFGGRQESRDEQQQSSTCVCIICSANSRIG